MATVKEVFSESSDRLSYMRVFSALMFGVATVFLFLKVNMDTLTWVGFALVALLYGLAFFPKAVQKKYEQFNLHVSKDKES